MKVTFEATTDHVPAATATVVCMPTVDGSRSTVLGSTEPSTSVSLPVTANKVTGVFLSVKPLSLLATGASFTEFTMIVMSAIFDVPPTLSFTV